MILDIFEPLKEINLFVGIFFSAATLILLSIVEVILISSFVLPVFYLKLFRFTSKINYQVPSNSLKGRKIRKNSIVYYFKSEGKAYFRSVSMFSKDSAKLKGIIKAKDGQIRVSISIPFISTILLLCVFSIFTAFAIGNIVELIGMAESTNFQRFFSDDKNIFSYIYFPLCTCVSIGFIIYGINSMRKRTRAILEDVIQIIEEHAV
ncbi:hypothetical protein [Bernardetia sp.]|uniref:hypothetical protein n=1 Tax=Bernardetia sp. TaxID=1937974 RepID=UPI0025B8766A|nr:hypothetical protein [Bernardetia sp.]